MPSGTTLQSVEDNTHKLVIIQVPSTILVLLNDEHTSMLAAMLESQSTVTNCESGDMYS